MHGGVACIVQRQIGDLQARLNDRTLELSDVRSRLTMASTNTSADRSRMYLIPAIHTECVLSETAQRKLTVVIKSFKKIYLTFKNYICLLHSLFAFFCSKISLNFTFFYPLISYYSCLVATLIIIATLV